MSLWLVVLLLIEISLFRLPRKPWPSELPCISWDSLMEDDSALLEWLLLLETYGLVLVTEAPQETGHVTRLADRVAFVKRTHYGYTLIIFPLNITAGNKCISCLTSENNTTFWSGYLETTSITLPKLFNWQLFAVDHSQLVTLTKYLYFKMYQYFNKPSRLFGTDKNTLPINQHLRFTWIYSIKSIMYNLECMLKRYAYWQRNFLTSTQYLPYTFHNVSYRRKLSKFYLKILTYQWNSIFISKNSLHCYIISGTAVHIEMKIFLNISSFSVP